jgi:hypothetical protein
VIKTNLVEMNLCGAPLETLKNFNTPPAHSVQEMKAQA